MPIDNKTLFGIHAESLVLLSKRAELLAANMANANTPNYKSRDMDFNRVLQRTVAEHTDSKNSMVRTHPLHVSAPDNYQQIDNDEWLFRKPEQSVLNGNTVDTQIENAEFLSNSLHYQTTIAFLSGRINSLLNALKGQ
jgi:flagellar basal-body rod protein FlgB